MSTATVTEKKDYSLKNYKVLGYNDDFTVCECCGKSDLKGTVHIMDLENEMVLHFGSTCAAKADKYDSLEAAAKAKVKIQSLVQALKTMRQNATLWGMGQVRIQLNEGKRVGFADVLYSDKGQELLRKCEAEYIAENNDRVVFENLNREQIATDRALAAKEIQESQENIDCNNAIEAANTARAEGTMSGLERISFFSTGAGKEISEKRHNKMLSVLASYPSLKYLTHIA